MEQQHTGQPGIEVGAVLREARESAGLSVEEVAGRIKLAPRQIEALERGDYAKLPEMAFIRGFVRSYARMLEIDDKALLEALPGAPAPVAIHARTARNEVPHRGAERRKQNLFWLGGAVALVAVVIIAWKYDAGDAIPKDGSASQPVEAVTTQPAPEMEQAASAPAAAAPAAPAEPETSAQTEAPAQTETPGTQSGQSQHAAKPAHETAPPASTHTAGKKRAASAPQAVPQHGAAAVPPTEGMTESAASSVEAGGQGAAQPVRASRVLRLEFAEDSWVEVKDATGHILLSMVGTQGMTRTVSGPPPLSVVVGNASGVKLFYKGQPVALSPAGGGNVARLKLE